MTKKIVLTVAVLLSLTSLASAATHVKGYLKQDGTYVQPHYRSSPNTTKYDNYSSQDNVNPHTGEKGSQRNEFSNPPSYNDSYGRQVYGSQGGKGYQAPSNPYVNPYDLYKE